MKIQLLAVLILLNVAASAKVRPKKVKPPKPIDWTHPYYSGKFVLCKKLRLFNPVENAKAQAWATDVFRKCGPQIVIKYATKYNFPAFGKRNPPFFVQLLSLPIPMNARKMKDQEPHISTPQT